MANRPRELVAAAAARLAGCLRCARRAKASPRAKRLSVSGLPHPTIKRETSYNEHTDLTGPQVEEGVRVGDHVVCRLRDGWIGSTRYSYGQVTRMNPIEVLGCDGRTHPVENLTWVMLSTDDGWLLPHDLGWQEPGRYVLLQLLSREWISAKVSPLHAVQPIRAGRLILKLEGLASMPEVCIEEDVALLFVPHDDCQEEFGHAQPHRGGWLSEHINMAFRLDEPASGETQEQAEHRQRLRWVQSSRTDGQYPIRSVWVHPQMKGGALNEFARRARQKMAESPVTMRKEAVMLFGPPAAGKSSIGRLRADQLTHGLVRTAQSLKYREEVNNDNLTDCMPGFPEEYKHVLAIKDGGKKRTAKQLWKKAMVGIKAGKVGIRNSKTDFAAKWLWLQMMREENLSAELWALQWLTYLVYHHGPVRDSLALDIIKVTVSDAHELPVFYSSCMAGKAMGRAMMILDLAHSDTKPIKHKKLPFRGFWPYTSQEARFERQEGRANKEKQEGKLLGGNLTSNLVDIHYHAQQAESNIIKLLGCLQKGVRATDSSSSSGEEERALCPGPAPESPRKGRWSFRQPSPREGGQRASEEPKAEKQQKTHVKVDHFLVIDNEGEEPEVLLDYASEEGAIDDEKIKRELQGVVEEAVTSSQLFDKEWDAFDPYVFRVVYFFLKTCFPRDHPLRLRGKGFKEQVKQSLSWPKSPTEVLPMVIELDEAVFFQKYGARSTATDTKQYRDEGHIADAISSDALAKLSEKEINDLKKLLSMMRKYTCLAMMQEIKDSGDWVNTHDTVMTPERHSRRMTTPDCNECKLSI
jgi:hypothetical protein